MYRHNFVKKLQTNKCNVDEVLRFHDTEIQSCI
jgi:hypothetical protein